MSGFVNVADTAGPQLLGNFINWGLMGVLSVQVYLYHVMFPDDQPALRMFVYGLLALEWVQTGLITADAFDGFVYHYGDVPTMVALHNAWFSVPVMCGIVSVAVQLFYARRIFVLTIAGGVLLKNVRSPADQRSTTPVIAIWLGGSALADIVIAVTMTILLLKTKTGFRRRDTLVNTLVRLAIESGTVTASVAIVAAVVFAALPQALYHECPTQALAKLYANMMLASLNNRAFIRWDGEESVAVFSGTVDSGRGGMSGSTVAADGHEVGGGRGRATESGTVVRVEIVRESDSDGGVPEEYPMREFQKGSIASVL